MAKFVLQLERARLCWVHFSATGWITTHLKGDPSVHFQHRSVCCLSVSVICPCLLPLCVCCLCVSDLVHFATCTLAQQPKGTIRPPADLQISPLSLGPSVKVHRPIQAWRAPVRVAVPWLTILHHTVSLHSQRSSSLRLRKPKLCTCSCTSPDIASDYVPLTMCLRLSFRASIIMDFGCASDYVPLTICPVASRELLL